MRDPYGTPRGEISFCAYNTGVGWRQIIEREHCAATTQEWFARHGRHAVHGGDRPIGLPGAAVAETERA